MLGFIESIWCIFWGLVEIILKLAVGLLVIYALMNYAWHLVDGLTTPEITLLQAILQTTR